jgi:cytochrome c-type biogenesis protein
MHDVTLIGAFIAGLVSFLSPCVLPLVPGYISMLSGIGIEQLRQGEQPKGLFSSALAFVIGFSVVFIGFGASASAVGGFLQSHKTLLTPIAGALILLFGLHLLGGLIRMTVLRGFVLGGVLVALGIASLVMHKPLFLGLGAIHFFSLSIIGFFGPQLARWLNQDVRLRNTDTKNPGMLRGFLLGFAFAFGWTPCIGPILGTVLTLAAASATIARGVLFLTAYSMGLAVPFLLTALGLDQFMHFYQNFRKRLHAVELFSGGLLLLVGGMVFFDKLTWLAGKLTFLDRFKM